MDADFEVAGLPCPDMSRNGLRRLEEGPTNTVFMAHAKRHCEKRTPLIVIENTKAGYWVVLSEGHSTNQLITQSTSQTFKGCIILTPVFSSRENMKVPFYRLTRSCCSQGLRMEMMEKLYGVHYHMCVLNVDTCHQGHTGVTRERVYVILWHKLRVKQVFDPRSMYKHITSYLTANIKTEPKDYLVSDFCDVWREAERLAVIRGKKLKMATRLPLTAKLSHSILGELD